MDGIAQLILQLSSLNEKAKGLPSENKAVPKGIIPADAGSSFTNDSNDVPAFLTSNERRRVKEIADIFAAAFKPASETGDKVQIPLPPPLPRREPEEQQNAIFAEQAKSSGLGGIISGILGLGSNAAGAAGGAGTALTILASAAGIAGIIAAAGPSLGLLMDGLGKAADVDWDKVKLGAGALREFMEIGVDFLKEMHTMGLDTLKTFFEIARANVDGLAKSVGTFAESAAKFKDVEWEDIGKAAVSLAGLMTVIGVSGVPAVAVFGALGALVMQVQAIAVASLGNALPILAAGMDDVLEVIQKFNDFDAVTLGIGLANMLGTISTISVAGIQAPLTALAGLGAQLAGMGLDTLAGSVEKFANAIPMLAIGIMKFEAIDAIKLRSVAGGIGAIGTSLTLFAAGDFASTVASAFGSLFGSDSFTKFLQLADKSSQLLQAADAVKILTTAFKDFTALPTNDLAYNLQQIADAVDNLDLSKLKKIYATPGVALGDNVVFELRAIRGYLLYDTGGSESGLINVTKKILEVDREQLKVLTDIKNMMIEARNRASTARNDSANFLQPPGGNNRNVKGNNVRNELSDIMLNPFLNR